MAKASILSSSFITTTSSKSVSLFLPLRLFVSNIMMPSPGLPSLPHLPTTWATHDGSARPIWMTLRTRVQFWPKPKAIVQQMTGNFPAAKSSIRRSLSSGPVEAWYLWAKQLWPSKLSWGLPRARLMTSSVLYVEFWVPEYIKVGGIIESSIESRLGKRGWRSIAEINDWVIGTRMRRISGRVSSPWIKFILPSTIFRLFCICSIAIGRHVAESKITGTLLVAISLTPRLPYEGRKKARSCVCLWHASRLAFPLSTRPQL